MIQKWRIPFSYQNAHWANTHACYYSLALSCSVSIASAAIFIKFSEQEITPYATAFNRFWITAVILGLWSGFKAVRRQQENSETPQSSPYTGAIIGQLFW
jgi:hypothetical protein